MLPVTVFGSAVIGGWLIDFIVAFCFGIAFQYFTIKPMRKLSAREGIVAALNADTLVNWWLLRSGIKETM